MECRLTGKIYYRLNTVYNSTVLALQPYKEAIYTGHILLVMNKTQVS